MQKNLTDKLNIIFTQFGISAKCINSIETNNYYLLDVELYGKGKIKDIQKYISEISLYLKLSKPNLNPIPEEGIIRLEFLKPNREIIDLIDYMPNIVVPNFDIPCLLGEAVNGEKLWIDIAKCPHILVAGTTGSGKSSVLHTIIANTLKYSSCHTILIDPKNIEFKEYENLTNHSISVSSSYDDAVFALDKAIEIMNFRYLKMRSGISVDNFPPVIIVIDEFSDLILQDFNKSFYSKLCSLAQKCRAAKIHIILATQRPSANVLDGAIKANFPARIACRVASFVDSKVILDYGGAENLAGSGDAILKNSKYDYCRFQAGYTTGSDVVNYFNRK